VSRVAWTIPPSVLKHLGEVPSDRPVVALIRHSVRGPLPDGPAGYTLPITEEGAALARDLGRLLGPRLRSTHASPLARTVQTAAELARGAEQSLDVVADNHLGDPGVFVVDARRGGETWSAVGHEAVMASLVSGSESLPGLADADAAARFLVHHMLAAAEEHPGIHAFVTHDSLVTATAGRLLDRPLGPSDWPWYLEAAFFWRSERGVEVRYRDLRASRTAPLCSLEDRDVVAFARREIAATVGLDCSARFFLSGGAFKTLLTGRPPRDLDLWAPSSADRTELVRMLDERGQRQPRRPFADAWRVGRRLVEVPDKVAPSTVEERHARYDIALSAVGVEHDGRGGWRAVVHPLAQESVNRGEVLLLKPLVNWRYALATLERLRRYGEELGYRVPAEEESEIWRIFDDADEARRRGMLDRFDRTARRDQGVEHEVARRLRWPGA